jgi:NAD(P)-dependent dehydrogenase (short-subunit alcohol dehydrogenase family)
MSPHSVSVEMRGQYKDTVNPQPFVGKVIAVTGASRGVGLALTKYLLACGAIMSMCATSEKSLAKAVAEIEDL